MIPLPLTSMVSVEKFVSYWGYVVPEKALLSCCFQYFLFVSKIWLYLCVVLFEFSMLGICWASQKCRFTFPIKCGQFSTIISSNKLPPLLSFFVSLHLALFVLLFWDSENIYVSLLDSAPQPPPLILCLPLFIIFSYCSLDWALSIALSLNSLVFLPAPICCWNHLVKFSLQLLYFLSIRNSIWLLFVISTSLFIVPTCLYIILLIFYSSLFLVHSAFWLHLRELIWNLCLVYPMSGLP